MSAVFNTGARENRMNQKKVPELTLDRSVRLLRCALGGSTLSLRGAIRLVERCIARNEVARASHEKAWREKHKDVEFLLL